MLSLPHGEMKTTDRKDAYTEINEGTNSVVATYGVAAVGINIPYLTRSWEPNGKSSPCYSTGRGVRKAQDKDL